MGWKELYKKLESTAQRRRKLLLGLDFDGTLVPIVDSPSLARLPRELRDRLAGLARRDNVSLAVVSGRSLRDIKGKVGLAGLSYIGNHGLEIESGGALWVHPGARGLERIFRSLARELKRRFLPLAGLEVEDKRLTISLHYRQMGTLPEPLLRRFLKMVRPFQEAVRISHGKKVLEIRPRLDWDKGNALLKLRRNAWAVALVGDDETDEEGFGTLGAGAITVRVGRCAKTAARFRLDGPQDVYRMLEAVERIWATGPQRRRSASESGMRTRSSRSRPAHR
ncbi:MAG: trehalose-phosphatase [Elusimicrobia bacterium]|nr:trehalose-phosphatase [Elusimicrobiota bacterium]